MVFIGRQTKGIPMKCTPQWIETLVIPLALLVACNSPEVNSSTAEWGLSGVAIVHGALADMSRAPLDSFRVGGGVLDGGAGFYTADQVVLTGNDGGYAVRVERRGVSEAFAADSVRMVLNAQSLKASDRRPDGTPQTASVQVWLKFERPPRSPYSLIVNMIVPFAR